MKTVDKKKADKKPAEKSTIDKKTIDKKSADKKATDKKTVDKKSAEKTTEKKASEKKTGDKKTSEKKTGDKKTSDKKTGDKNTSDKKAADKNTSDKKTTDKKSTDKKTTDNKAADNKAADKKTTDKKSTGQKTTDNKTSDKKAVNKKTIDKNTLDRKTTDKQTGDKKISDKKPAGKIKTVDKMEILQSQSAEFIEQGETGKFLKLIPDTFIIKGAEGEHGVHQGYAIRHLNRKDIILIDVVEEATKIAVKKLVEDGYTIKGLLISNNLVYKTTYADAKTMSEDAGGAPVFMHPRITPKNGDKVKDITAKHDLIKSFGLTISDLPGSGGGSVLIYSDINDGMLFTGADAEGSSYDSDLNTFERPKMESKNDEFGLAQAWGAFVLPFSYLFPLVGKPGFNLEEGAQQDILMKLGRTQE